jgi:hypothetical protein
LASAGPNATAAINGAGGGAGGPLFTTTTVNTQTCLNPSCTSL